MENGLWIVFVICVIGGVIRGILDLCDTPQVRLLPPSRPQRRLRSSRPQGRLPPPQRGYRLAPPTSRTIEVTGEDGRIVWPEQPTNRPPRKPKGTAISNYRVKRHTRRVTIEKTVTIEEFDW